VEQNKQVAFAALAMVALLAIGYALGSVTSGNGHEVKFVVGEGGEVSASTLRSALSSGDNDKAISVSGTATIKTAPDLAVVSIGFTTQLATAQEALETNSETMNNVIFAIRGLGIDDRKIKTRGVSLYPVYTTIKSDDTTHREITAYAAENTIEVEVDDLGKTGEVIDAANKAGANTIQGISFEVSEEKEKELKIALLSNAVEDAKERALALARPLGINDLTPLRITEGYSGPVPIFMAEQAVMTKSAAATPISPGEIEVSASVNIAFGFE